jgi:anaerobic selenocysteine-containing dehydrogenase
MCSLRAYVDDGKVLRVEGDPDHPHTDGYACAKVNRDAELIHSPDRIATPLRRIGSKGGRDFAPFGWDEALDEIVSRWKVIIAESGPLALLGYAYSAHQGQMNRGVMLGLFHALGSSRLLAGAVCDTCCEAAWEMTLGPVGGVDPEAIEDSDLIISWGCDLVAVNVHLWTKIERLKRRGVTVICIDPRRSRTAARADWHIPIRIGTDAALALGVMHILVRDQLCDRGYLDVNTLGFDQLQSEVVPRFPPERTAEITGLMVSDIERLASLFARARTPFIRLGEGMTRLANGGQAVRAVCVLPALTGAYARRGGGALLLTAASCTLNYDALQKPSGPASTRVVNHLRLGDDLLNLRDPPIRALFVAANNPAVTCPDASKVRRGLKRDDLFTVVHDPFLTLTARYADIVLPATTYLETEDFFRSYGNYYMQYAPPAVAPQGQAWSNLKLAQALAQRMELTDPVFRMAEHDLLRALFDGATGHYAAFDVSAIPQAGPIAVAPPDAQEFRTPSGKLEIFSQTLADNGIAPLPDWHPDPEETHDAARWPLRLLTAPGYFQAHTTYEAVAFLSAREGAPFCILNPRDAAERQLIDGQSVRLFNDRGSVKLVLHISDEVQAGVVLVPGQRTDADDTAGTINILCSDRYTDMGAGATYQSTFLDVIS